MTEKIKSKLKELEIVYGTMISVSPVALEPCADNPYFRVKYQFIITNLQRRAFSNSQLFDTNDEARVAGIRFVEANYKP